MTSHLETIGFGALAFAQVMANVPQFDFTNITFATLTAFLVWWLTNQLAQKIDKLGEKIEKLGDKIDAK